MIQHCFGPLLRGKWLVEAINVVPQATVLEHTTFARRQLLRRADRRKSDGLGQPRRPWWPKPAAREGEASPPAVEPCPTPDAGQHQASQSTTEARQHALTGSRQGRGGSRDGCLADVQLAVERPPRAMQFPAKL